MLGTRRAERHGVTVASHGVHPRGYASVDVTRDLRSDLRGVLTHAERDRGSEVRSRYARSSLLDRRNGPVMPMCNAVPSYPLIISSPLSGQLLTVFQPTRRSPNVCRTPVAVPTGRSMGAAEPRVFDQRQRVPTRNGRLIPDLVAATLTVAMDKARRCGVRARRCAFTRRSGELPYGFAEGSRGAGHSAAAREG